MTDRELLELAAKASGHDALGEMYGWDEIGPGMFIDANHPPTLWNPLADDGDALRLAVELEITPGKHDDTVVPSRSAAWRSGAAHCSLWEPAGNNSYAATRRAIVLAAAEIGKAMP